MVVIRLVALKGFSDVAENALTVEAILDAAVLLAKAWVVSDCHSSADRENWSVEKEEG